MSKYFDEELAECVAAKAEGRVISKEIAQRIAAAWHTPDNRLVSFSTAGIVMHEMVEIVNADMKDMCSRPDHFDADDSVKDLGTVPQNLVMLYALREYFESVCANLHSREYECEYKGKYLGYVTLDEWSDGQVEVTYSTSPYGIPHRVKSLEEAQGYRKDYIRELIQNERERLANLAEEQELAQSENPNA